jgi:hypothetical protein
MSLENIFIMIFLIQFFEERKRIAVQYLGSEDGTRSRRSFRCVGGILELYRPNNWPLSKMDQLTISCLSSILVPLRWVHRPRPFPT